MQNLMPNIHSSITPKPPPFENNFDTASAAICRTLRSMLEATYYLSCPCVHSVTEHENVTVGDDRNVSTCFVSVFIHCISIYSFLTLNKIKGNKYIHELNCR